MHNFLRFGLQSLLALQLALGVGLYGARTLHAVPMLTHGVGQQTGLPSRMRESAVIPFSRLHGLTLRGITALSAHNIWVVGNFTSDPQSIFWHTLIEHWDGTHWSIVPNPGSGANNSNLASIAALTAHNIWAVGSFDDSGQLIEHWDGTHWSIVPSPDPNSTFEPSAKSVLPHFPC